jgi:hypothetical protein
VRRARLDGGRACPALGGGNGADRVPLGNSVSCRELGFAAGSGAWLGHLRVLLSIVYRLVRCLLGLLAVLARSDLSKDAELLVLRHENQVLRRQLSGRLRWDHADRLWLAALSRLVSRRQWTEVFPVHPRHDLALAPRPRRPQVGLQQSASARTAVHR